AVAGEGQVSNNETNSHFGAIGIVKTVLDNVSKYQNLHVAMDDGYVLATGCMSGPNGGAMGVHYVRPDLLFSDPSNGIFDGMLDASTPEILVYEPTRWGSMKLVAAEYVVIKDAWEAENGVGSVPILEGQHLFFSDAPNRNALPPHYELHVWAFKHNRSGMFAPWNPDVSCEYYDPDA
ncbi:MAG: hypothetical protein WCD66_12680, partial [Rhodanobacteraceae bacterium]